MTIPPPFALTIHGDTPTLFELSERLGFDGDMAAQSQALALSLFEDGPDMLRLQALFESRGHAQACLDHLKRSVDGFSDLTYAVTQLDDEDWVKKSQSGLPPVIAGRFCVYGHHDQQNISADSQYSDCQFHVQIEAGLAFGTGHHGTTKACLLALDHMLQTGPMPTEVLDLGCGAGTLAIAYALATGHPVMATDIDPDAVAVTQDNAKQNGVADQVDAILADGFDTPAVSGLQFDLIFANILAEPLMGLATDIIAALQPGGQVILSGILDEKHEKARAHFSAHGLDVLPMPSVEGWTNLIGSKP